MTKIPQSTAKKQVASRKNQAGRPESKAAKTSVTLARASTTETRIDLRTKPEVKELIERAASYKHMTVSAYLLSIAVERAREDLKLAEALILDDASRDLFFSALAAPPEPNNALRELFERST